MSAMTPRLWAFSLAPVLAASSAYAQAPGDVSPAPYYAPAPTPAPVYPPAHSPVMARRWAIGLSLGGYSVAPDGAAEGTETQFRVAELALRYRASRRLELELGLSGGREVLDDETEGDLATGSVTLALRYRFRPERRWSWFVMAGLGGTVIAPHQSTDAEREGATRPLGMLGIGVERRFRRFALQAEVRGVGIGPREDAMEEVPAVDGGGAIPPTMPVPRLPGSAATTHAEELGGGMFTIGASYYF
jgi:opacity protein-like surface antigen